MFNLLLVYQYVFIKIYFLLLPVDPIIQSYETLTLHWEEFNLDNLGMYNNIIMIQDYCVSGGDIGKLPLVRGSNC